jgi:hypothetical protein
MKQNEANINNLNQFIGRLPASARPEHRNLVQEAFGIVGALGEKARAIRADGRFTSAGHMEQIQAVARDGILDQLKQVKGRTQALTDDLDRLRAAVALRAPAKDDITGELRRAEIRAHMRSLPTAERVRIALSEDETVSWQSRQRQHFCRVSPTICTGASAPLRLRDSTVRCLRKSSSRKPRCRLLTLL